MLPVPSSGNHTHSEAVLPSVGIDVSSYVIHKAHALQPMPTVLIASDLVVANLIVMLLTCTHI